MLSVYVAVEVKLKTTTTGFNGFYSYDVFFKGWVSHLIWNKITILHDILKQDIDDHDIHDIHVSSSYYTVC